MDFLNKKSADDWARLEDKEIDKILKEIELMPDLESLKDHVNEFKNGLKALKKNKKESLAKNVHARAEHLHKVFSELSKEFGTIDKESVKAEKMEAHLNKNFFEIQIATKKGMFFLNVKKNQEFILGRSTVKSLSRYFSRNLFEGIIKNSSVLLNYKGSNPCTLIVGGKTYNFKTTYSDPVKIPVGVECEVRVGPDMFRFKITPYE